MAATTPISSGSGGGRAPYADERDDSGNVVTPLTVPVALFRGAELYDVQRVLMFYSHTRRTTAEKGGDDQIGFDRRMCSNLYPVNITITDDFVLGMLGGKAQWSSTEHAFQAAKCELEADRTFLAGLSTGNAAAYGQGRMKLNASQKETLISLGVPASDFFPNADGWKRSASGHYPRVSNWEEVKPRVMMAALRSKFTQPGGICAVSFAKLVASGVNFFFVEHTKNDKIWADGLNGQGTNFLGKLLTQLLIEIRQGTTFPIDRSFLDQPNQTLLNYH
ncbi:hypothetical protein Pelo_13399 [Pelomyxa schiedti]|nr:hypothetical protein Pelo_13399 [Pelomyxa schiedti]